MECEQKLIEETLATQKDVKDLESQLEKAKQKRSIAFSKLQNFMNETGQVEFDNSGYRFKVTKESERTTIDKEKVKKLLNEEQYNSCLKVTTIESSLRLFKLKEEKSQLEKVNEKIKQHVFNNTDGIE